MDQVLKALPQPLRRIASDLLSSDGDNARSQRSAVMAFVIRVASAAILFFSQVLLARWLGIFEYGVYTYVWVWITVIGTMCCLGFATTVVRFVPEYTEQGKFDHARGFLRAARGVSVASGLLCTIVGLLALQVFDGWYDDIYKVPMSLALLCLPAFAATDYQDGVGRSQSWLGLALVPPYILRPVLLFCFVGLAVAMGWPHDAQTAAFALVVAAWITAIVQYGMQKHCLAKIIPPGPCKYDLKFWIIVSLPVLMLEGFTLVMMNMDVLLLDLFVDPDQIAIYYATARTITLIAFVHFAVTAAVMPRFATYHANGDFAVVRQLLRQSRMWTFAPSLAGAIIVIALGKPLLWLFGSDFMAGYPLMFVLVIGLLARAAVGPTQGLMVVTGHQNIPAIILSGAVAANILLNLTLIPKFGLMGAASATSIAYGIEAFALYFIARRIFDPDRQAANKDMPYVTPAE